MGALAAAQEQMVNTEKLASLGRLSAGIAHEVNNPLNFVKNSIPPLKESLLALDGRLGSSDPKLHQALSDSREVIQIMENGVDRMSQILRALLDFSRQSPSSAAAEDVDLRAAAESALALLRHELKDRVEVETEFEGSLIVRGSSGQLGQVLMNVIKNAIHAVGDRDASAGGGKITIQAVQRGDKAVVSITDNGCGMPPEAIARAFEPFFTTKPVGRGTGLGLAIVHGIVEKHGGTVELSSVVGEGTTVRVTLPRRQVAEA
jgi:signal transduction histidine kinase